MSTELPAPTLSSLEKLPAELIENILFYVVSDVEPPSNGNDLVPLRCELENPKGHSFASGLLAHKFVSRALRNHSWRALATVIGETVFDISSTQSIENFIAVSTCTEVVLWIKKLTFGCFHVDESEKSYPFIEKAPRPGILHHGWVQSEASEVLDHSSNKELERVKKDHQTQFPTAWQPAHAYDSSIGARGHADTNIHEEPATGLSQLLSSHLVLLQNLTHVKYWFHPDAIPSRFRFLAHAHPDNDKTIFDWRLSKLNPVSIGQALLLEAIENTGLHLKTLELVTNEDGQRYLPTSLKADTTTKLFKSIEFMTLENCWSLPAVDIYQGSSCVEITQTLCPALKFLRARGWSGPESIAPPLLQQLDVPRLEKFTISEYYHNIHDMLGFLKGCQDSLRCVVLEGICIGGGSTLLELLPGLNLERLEIDLQTYDWRRCMAVFQEDVSRTTLYNAARTIVFKPSQMADEMELYWASKAVVEGGD